jgi:hypothetical protein
LAVYAIGRNLRGPRAGLLAALGFAALSGLPRPEAILSNTEVFANLPLAAALAVATAAGRSRSRSILVGLLVGAVALLRPAAVLPALVALGWLAYRSSPGWGQRAKPVLVGLVAAAVVPALAAGYFASRSAWGDLRLVLAYSESYTSLPFRYGGPIWQWLPAAFWKGFSYLAWPSLPFCLAGLAGLILAARRPDPARGLSAVFLLASLASVLPTGYFLAHYFVQMLPALALSAAVLGDDARRASRPFRRAAIPALVVLFCWPLAVSAPLLVASNDQISRAIFGVHPFIEARWVGAEIREHSAPTDTVYILGSEPEILFYAQRRSPTRHIHLYPLTSRNSLALQFQDEVIAALRRSPPRFLVAVRAPTSLFQGPPNDDLRIFDQVRGMIDASYVRRGAVFLPASGPAYTVWSERPFAEWPAGDYLGYRMIEIYERQRK